MLWMFQRVFTGVPYEINSKLKDVSIREVCVVVPLLAISLFIGLYPKPVIDRVEPTVERVMANFRHKTDYKQPKADRVHHLGERASNASETQP
jgi:NADH-quinone oxidoreductase subunit M